MNGDKKTTTLGQVGKALAKKVKGRVVAVLTTRNQNIAAIGPSSDSDEESNDEVKKVNGDRFVWLPYQKKDAAPPSKTPLNPKKVVIAMHRANFSREEIDNAVAEELPPEEIEAALLEAQRPNSFEVDASAVTVPLSGDIDEDITKAAERSSNLEVPAEQQDDFDAEMGDYNAEGEPPAFDPHGEPDHPGGEPNDPNGNTESSTEKRGLK